jgi:arsenite methyltransferase
MTQMLQFEDEAARRVEQMYLSPDVVAQRRAVLAALALQRGEHVLDVGSGPGLLLAAMAGVLGPDGLVAGIDPSESMHAIARAYANVPDGAPIDLRPGGATEIPFPDASFDVVVSTQVLEYVPDTDAALAEMYRVLRPGGRALILDTDLDSIVWRSSDDARMERVLRAWEQHLAHPRLPRVLLSALRRAGFHASPPQVVPLLNCGYAEDTYTAGVIPMIESFVSGRDGITAKEAADWASDVRNLGPDSFMSLNRYVFSASRP